MSDFEDHPKVTPGAILEASEVSGCNILGLDNFLPEIKSPIVQAFLEGASVDENDVDVAE
jgi:hypothetical protein